MGFAFEWQELVVGGRAIDDYGVPIRDDRPGRVRATPMPSTWAPSAGRSGTTRTRPSAPSRRSSPSAAASASTPTCGRSRSSRRSCGASPLRPTLLRDVDLLIVRELTSGLYFGQPSEERATPDGRSAVDTLVYTEAEIRRVRAPCLSAGGGPPPPPDERGQGQRAGHVAPLAQGRRRAAAGVPEGRRRAPARRLRGHAAHPAPAPPSTSS